LEWDDKGLCEYFLPNLNDKQNKIGAKFT
jgi:hypothetical protein